MNASWKTVRVFISSTFKDMQAERDQLVRFVFPKLREELAKHRIHLIDVDLRWGVTSDQDALGVCREVIDECRPRFMGILGGRYGWVPEGREHSITADEIHYGVLQREAEKRGRAFFYLRKETDTLAIPEAEARLGGYREYAQPDEIKRYGHEKADAMARQRDAKLVSLKKAIIDAGLPVSIYDAKWDENQKRLTALEAFGNQVHTDLFQSLKEDPALAPRFSDANSAQLDEFAEEADQMEAFIEERTERFILGSRQALMNEMLAFAAADGTPNIFVLTGDPGSGKSAFLAKFVQEMGSAQSPVRSGRSSSQTNRTEDCADHFVVPHFVGASTGSTDLRRTLSRLCHELTKAAGSNEPLPLDIKELITHFQKLLAEAAAKQPIILVFDALNQFDATDGAHWLNWLPRELPPRVRIVASVIAPAAGEKEHQTLAILRNRKDARVEELKTLNETDTQSIIEGYLKRYSKRFSADQIAALKEKPASNLPLYILTALEELRTLGTYEEITDRIRTLPGDTRALFGWILTERLAHDSGFRDREGRPCGAALVEKFAACLGVSRHGLSPAELTALLDPGDPLGNVAALLRLLRPYLMRRGELLDFYHGQFREAAEAAHLDTPEKQRDAHQSVATCLQAFADPHRDGQCRDASPHALSELPHHQTRAEAWPDLIATLENIFFLEAKVIHGMAFDLAEDFTTAVDALPPEHVENEHLRLLTEALRRDIHFIARHAMDYPQALFQCLWNSGWWYDCPERDRHYEGAKGHSRFRAFVRRFMSQLDPLLRHPITSLRMMNGRERREWILSAIRQLLRHVNSSWYHTPATKPLAPRIGLHTLLERWRQQRDTTHQSSAWLRNLRPPLEQLGAGQVSVLRGHTKPVNCVSVIPNSRMLISGSEDNTIRVWDVENSQEIAVLTGHEDAVQSIAVAPNGSRFFSGSWDGTLRVWDIATLQSTCTVKAHENWIKSVALSPCGKWIVTGSLDHTLKVWDAHDLKHMATLRGHEEPVTSVAISPDGQFIYSGSRDETVRVWRLPGGDKVSVLRWPSHIVTCIAVSELFPKYVACGATDGRGFGVGSVSLWDVPSQKMICQGSCPGSDIYAVTFSPSGKEILSGSLDKAVRRWSISERFKSSNVVWDRAINGVWSLCFLPDEKRFAAGSSDGIIRILSNQDVGSSPRPMGHRRWIEELTFNVNAKQLVTRNFSPNDDPLFVWDIKTGLPVKGSIVHDGEEKTASRSGNDFAEIVVHLDGMKPLFYAAALNPFMSLVDAKTYGGAEGGHLHILNIEFPAI